MATRAQLALAFALLAPLPAIARASESQASSGCRVRTERVDARGVATVAAECAWPLAPREVIATLRDPAKLARALSSLQGAWRLPDGRVVQVHQPGWPFADRQVTLDWRERSLVDGGVSISYRLSSKQTELGEGREPIRADEGLWIVRTDGAGGSRVSYTSRYDAGGSLKPWLVRRFQRAGIARSLVEIRAATELDAARLALANFPLQESAR